MSHSSPCTAYSSLTTSRGCILPKREADGFSRIFGSFRSFCFRSSARLRLLSLAVVVTSLQQAVGHTIRGRVIVYTACGASIVVYAAALAILDVEGNNPDAKIRTLGDALWWASTTVTTVGYGDLHPVTGPGRLVAVALMVGGITLLGLVTATLASWIVERVAEEDTANEAATRAQIEELREEIRRLSNLVTRDREPAYGEGREAI